MNCRRREEVGGEREAEAEDDGGERGRQKLAIDEEINHRVN